MSANTDYSHMSCSRRAHGTVQIYISVESARKMNAMPTPEEIKKVDESVTKTLESKATSRGKYNSYTPRQRAQIGQHAADHGYCI